MYSTPPASRDSQLEALARPPRLSKRKGRRISALGKKRKDEKDRIIL